MTTHTSHPHQHVLRPNDAGERPQRPLAGERRPLAGNETMSIVVDSVHHPDIDMRDLRAKAQEHMLTCSIISPTQTGITGEMDDIISLVVGSYGAVARGLPARAPGCCSEDRPPPHCSTRQREVSEASRQHREPSSVGQS